MFVLEPFAFVCFRPPRDLDSKACVTIGEKVLSPGRLCPTLNPIQGLDVFSLGSYVTAHCLLLRTSAFGLEQSHARLLPRSLSLCHPPPPPMLRAKWMFLIAGRLECLLLPSRL